MPEFCADPCVICFRPKDRHTSSVNHVYVAPSQLAIRRRDPLKVIRPMTATEREGMRLAKVRRPWTTPLTHERRS